MKNSRECSLLYLLACLLGKWHKRQILQITASTTVLEEGEGACGLAVPPSTSKLSWAFPRQAGGWWVVGGDILLFHYRGSPTHPHSTFVRSFVSSVRTYVTDRTLLVRPGKTRVVLPTLQGTVTPLHCRGLCHD